MSNDLIIDTAARQGVQTKALFWKAAVNKGFTNAQEVSDYRFAKWFKYGEIPEWVTDYCLSFWRTPHAKRHQQGVA
jgi:hypothetical protein